MTVPLSDHQFELDGIPFGIGTDITIENEGFDPGTIEQRTQDVANSVDDSVAFGVDYISPPVWLWQMSTDTSSEIESLDALAQLARIWSWNAIRARTGQVTHLRYRVGGRLRRVYGRPRRFAYGTDNRILGGYLAVTADFTLADARTYEDEEESYTVPLTPVTSEGGLTDPLTDPLGGVVGDTPEQRAIVVGGTVPTPVVVQFDGAALNPRISVSNWTCALRGNTEFDDQIIVDARPWARTILRGDASLAGRLSRKTFLREMVLPPGSHQVHFGSDDPGSSAIVTIRWRNAHPVL